MLANDNREPPIGDFKEEGLTSLLPQDRFSDLTYIKIVTKF